MKRFAHCLIFVGLFFVASPAMPAQKISVDKWDNLSDRDISPHGKAALNISHRIRWDHAESEHFVYHFENHTKPGSQTVYDAAEKYYHIVKKIFGIERDDWRKKGHIFVFLDRRDWEKFCERVGQTNIPLAFTSGWELYIHADAQDEQTIKTMVHELTHIIVFRFLDGTIPLFLNEGFADYIGYNALIELKGYNPAQIESVGPVEKNDYIPISQLIQMQDYPNRRESVVAFYRESECLVRYLIRQKGGSAFYQLLRGVSQGDSFKGALEKYFQIQYYSFEEDFKKYATKKT